MANPQDAQSEVVFWGLSRRVPYMPGSADIAVWDITFGKELPVAVWQQADSDEALRACGQWGFGLWAPLGVHLVDAVAEESSPILNSDYRLALAFKVARGVTPRDLVSAKVQVGHESTHLGDEFVLRASQAYGAAFQRVNVSYEYVEFGVNWDHYFGAARQHVVSVRGSGVRASDFGGDTGWYSPALLDGTLIQPSRVNFEPAVGVEYAPKGTRGWRPLLSYEGRLRTIYDYGKTSADQREDRQFSSSIVVGLRNLGWNARGMPDLIAKGYYGVNPNGQFRSQRDYWMFGFGLLIRL
jgi:hypothetical protein